MLNIFLQCRRNPFQWHSCSLIYCLNRPKILSLFKCSVFQNGKISRNTDNYKIAECDKYSSNMTEPLRKRPESHQPGVVVISYMTVQCQVLIKARERTAAALLHPNPDKCPQVLSERYKDPTIGKHRTNAGRYTTANPQRTQSSWQSWGGPSVPRSQIRSIFQLGINNFKLAIDSCRS